MEPKHSQFPPIVGLAGTFASGKDTLARDLVKRGHYVHFSTSDMVRAEASRLYGSTERPVLARTADELRHRDGAGVFAARALEMAGVRPVIVSGIRSLGGSASSSLPPMSKKSCTAATDRLTSTCVTSRPVPILSSKTTCRSTTLSPKPSAGLQTGKLPAYTNSYLE